MDEEDEEDEDSVEEGLPVRQLSDMDPKEKVAQ